MSTIIAFVIGTLLGGAFCVAEIGEVGILPTSWRPCSWCLSAMPYYLLALVLVISIFSVALGSSGSRRRVDTPTIVGWNLKSMPLDVARHAILPGVAIVLGGIGFWALGMRGLMGKCSVRIPASTPRRRGSSRGGSSFATASGTRCCRRSLRSPWYSGRSCRGRSSSRRSSCPVWVGCYIRQFSTVDIFVINGIVTLLIGPARVLRVYGRHAVSSP